MVYIPFINVFTRFRVYTLIIHEFVYMSILQRPINTRKHVQKTVSIFVHFFAHCYVVCAALVAGPGGIGPAGDRGSAGPGRG
jgi:hypothetical protein